MAKEQIDIKDQDAFEVTNCDFKPNETIERAIYTIRGVQVMLDKDLSVLYGVETRVLNQAVRRNAARFPSHFMFQLTKEEYDSLRSQIVTLEKGCGDDLKSQIVISSWGGNRKMPYAFTEQGVSQLSAVLKSKTAVLVSIRIIDAFVAMRRFLSSNAEIYRRLTTLEHHQIESDHKIDTILNKMEENTPKISSEQLFATGCIWDAWDYISQLVRSAKTRIILIDNFVDERVLTLLTKRANGVSATIHSRYTQQFTLDLQKHNEQYPTVNFIQLPQKAHDRFLIVDDEAYLLGASVKDMGTSLCAVTKLETSPEKVLALL